jgi:hypothetical protein
MGAKLHATSFLCRMVLCLRCADATSLAALDVCTTGWLPPRAQVLDCVDGICTPVASIQDKLHLPVDPQESVALEVGVLFGMLIVLRIAVYIALKKKTAA